jgi:hypothetical protein
VRSPSMLEPPVDPDTVEAYIARVLRSLGPHHQIARHANYELDVQRQFRRLVQSSTAAQVRASVCITTGVQLRGPEGA